MGIYEPYVKADGTKKKGKPTPRPEQSDAIERAFKYFKKNDGKGAEFLWNAKMRFGKTVCALWLIEKLNKELGKKKVLIVTHRPVVNASWYGDFRHLFEDSLNQYSYGTAKETDDESSMKDFYDISRDAKSGKCVLFFASMQYLRLSKLVGGKQDDSKEKEDILNYDWDLVIIDEAHEGTQTELGEGVINYLHKDKTFMLHLSGTPFNLLDKFKSEQIYNWDYIKEQQYKRQWDKDHENKKAKASPSFFDNEEEEVNPYRELPQMEILTFRLGDMIDEQTIQDAATGKFSFTEFFRVKKGHDVPKEERGKFLHEEQVLAFIKKLCEKSDVSHYPFSNDEYRNCFRHTLWVVPGVPEAQALKRLLESTPLCKNPKFGFKVINVAGNSDDDEQRSNALDKVLNAIGIDEKNNIDNSGQTRTITLSCGRLTTGVTVRPWTAVLYLKGSDTTSASTYMQTIFRVQSPHTLNGMMKSKCYVFDFAPERALTMMAETAKYSRAFERKEKKGEKKQKSVIDAEDKEQMSKLIDVCPIIETTNGSPVIIHGKMQSIDCNRLFSQLNSVYVDKVVRNGFDHPSLYNYNEFLRLDLEDEFNLNYIDSMFGDEGKSGGSGDGKDVVVNTQDDLTPEQKAALEEERKEREKEAKKAREDAKKKYKEKLEQMTPEEREKFLKEKEEHARKLKLIHQSKDKLSGLSKRIPLMMYGANVEDFKEVTIDNFTNKRFIDDESWNEFMPKGVSRELFKKLSKFYNADVFKDAGVKIRQLALEADNMKVEERIARIAQIFKWFKNPDKETVLTPWEVVNRHMSSTLGGYTFFEDDFKTPCTKVDEKTGEILSTQEPRFVDQGNVTKEIFGDGTLGNIDEKAGKINTKVLEINSKTGLYPLYVAYSLFRHLLPVYASEKGLMADNPEDYSAEDEQVIWDEVVKNNLYVICNTKMAERITRRTLVGFRKNSDGSEIKLHVKQDKLVTRVGEDKEALITDLLSDGYWNNTKMRKKDITFNAVVGNPPYQDSSINNHSASVYHKFIDVAYNISDYATLITPGRFLFGVGDTPNDWNQKFMADKRFKVVEYQSDSKVYFPSVEIKGGVAITLSDTKNEPGPIGIYSACEELRTILSKVAKKKESKISSIVYTPATYKLSAKAFSDNPWLSQAVGKEKRLRTNIFEKAARLFEIEQPQSNDYVKIVGLDDSQKRIYRWIHKEYIASNINCENFKVIVPEANGSGKIGEPLASPFVFGPYTGHTETFISIGSFASEKEALSVLKYICTKFARTLLATKKVTQHTLPDVWDNIPLQDFTESSNIDWSKDIPDIDQQLYDNYKLSKEEREFIEKNVQPMD
jgi:hypothetical protein